MDRLTERELIIDASLANLDAVLDATEEVASSCGASAKTVKQCQLAIEELFVNVASYAYPEGETHKPCRITFASWEADDAGHIRIEIADRGEMFDPLAKEDPDIKTPIKDRKNGGMGIMMTKKLMNSVEYRFVSPENIVTIEKQWALDV